MTEQDFDRKFEHAAERFEQKMEGAADKLDKTVSRKWEQKSFRILMKSISFAAEIGLMLCSGLLFHSGHKMWASICFWLGALGLLCDLLRLIFLRRK